MQVLIDADNVPPGRIRVLLDAVAAADPSYLRIIVAGRARALQRVTWPEDAEVIQASGWQRADVALAHAYVADEQPLILVTGDGDFVQLAQQHPGPVLVLAAASASAGRMRDVATVLDPVHDGQHRLTQWLNGASAI